MKKTTETNKKDWALSIGIDQIEAQINRLKDLGCHFYINYWEQNGTNGLTVTYPSGEFEYLDAVFFGVNTTLQSLYIYHGFEDFIPMGMDTAIEEYELAESDLEPVLLAQEPMDYLNKIAISPCMSEADALERVLEFLENII